MDDFQDEPEYQGGSFPRFVLAGAVAGATEHLVMFPFDTLKTHMQAVRATLPIHRTMAEASRHILKTDGLIGFFRGISAMALGAAPAHGVYFSTYEYAKRALDAVLHTSRLPLLPGGDEQQKHQQHQQLQQSVQHHVNPIVTSIAGGLATTAADFVQTPMDVVKQRMQLDSAQFRGSMIRCAAHTYRAEGWRAFWLSYPTTLVMNVPHHAAQFTVYEACKSLLLPLLGNTHPAATHFLSGALAGGLAGVITTPLDVAKTRLQTQGGEGYRTLRGTLAALWREGGMRALMSGAAPRFWFHAPSTALCWTAYEACKRLLGV